MKHSTVTTFFILSLIAMGCAFVACEDYLVRAPESRIDEEEVFSNFDSYQGYVEQMYDDDVDLSYIFGWNLDFNLSDHMYLNGDNWHNAAASDEGNFRAFNESGKYVGPNGSGWSSEGYSIYSNSWQGIRIANEVLKNIDMLENATQDERDIIQGQAYFFRGYFHFRIATYYGGLPYVDEYLEPTSDLRRPRLNFQTTADKIVEDLDRAIELLPYDWDEVPVGQRTAGSNEGRAVKGAAMGYKAKVLLYAGSPLMNKFSGADSTSGLMGDGGPLEYDQEYLERAAEAAWEVMQQSEEFGGTRFGLMSWEDYHTNFWRDDGSFPYNKEILWNNNGITSPGSGWMYKVRLSQYMPGSWGEAETRDITAAPTQNLIDKFEASNGYPIDDPQSNYDPDDPWENRDPRFDYNILVDDEQHGTSPNAVAQLYVGGVDRDRGGTTGYLATKFWAPSSNKWDGDWVNVRWNYPDLRLADVYLIYAEAVNEVYGPNMPPDFSGGPPTAVDVVNIVRQRANHVPVPGDRASSQDQFRQVIRNEREVEFCFEQSDHWHDIRRWYVAHQEAEGHKIQYRMNFDEQHTTFTRQEINTRVFDERHYWVPFPEATTNIYSGWPQNPGW